MIKIALFGTSADPPTAGHQAIINWLSQHYDRVVVWASDNPFKSHQTSLEQRSKMLQLLIEETDPPQHNIYLYQEFSSRRTLETVEKALVAWHQAELTLVIGSDLVNQLPRWYRVEDLLRQVQVLVVSRPGYSIDDASLEKLRRLGASVAIAPINPPNVSSTAYRENGDIDALTPGIEAYIHQEQLYICQDTVQSR